MMCGRFAFVLSAIIGFCACVQGEEASSPVKATGSSLAKTAARIRVLVVSGGHEFAVEPFRQVFLHYPDMDCTFVDEKIGGEAYDDISNWSYDVIVLYNHKRALSERQRANFLRLMDRGVGLVILHHAMDGYCSWPEFQKIVGVTSYVSRADDATFRIDIADPRHYITQGVKDFSVLDEAYQGQVIDPGVHVLLSTEEPRNARAVAWVHTYRKARVCYFQLGHDANTYSRDVFRTILGRAIRYVLGNHIISSKPAEMTECRRPSAPPFLSRRSVKVNDLRCECHQAPLGIDAVKPRLSWIIASDSRGEVQTAYRVLVASTSELLAKNAGDLWDSGKMASDATTQVRYGGSPLGSSQRVFWKVRAWGKDDSNWKRDGGTVTMDVTIPANTKATVFVPARNSQQVTESGRPAATAEGVTFQRMAGNAAVYEVVSGTYHFNSLVKPD